MAVENAYVYTLIGPGAGNPTAVFNLPTDPNNVGYITDVSGLDSAEVRESAEPRSENDGGVHGSFFYGRRTLTMEGLIWPTDPAAAREAAQNRLFAASDAMRTDAVLTWTEADTFTRFLKVRRQQPTRITERRPKRFLLGLVSADHRIYKGTPSVAGGVITITEQTVNSPTTTATNGGNCPTPPRFTVTPTGPVTLTNSPWALTLVGLTNGVLATIDFSNHTVMQAGVNKYSSVQFPSSVWWDLQPGVNTFSVTGTSSYTLKYRDAWI